MPDEAGRRSYLETRAYGRVLAEDVNLASGVIEAGIMLEDDLVAAHPRRRVRRPGPGALGAHV